MDEDMFGIHFEKLKKFMIQGALLFLAFIFISGLYTFYEITLKENTLEFSPSPSSIHNIEVVQKGEATLFGPSSVRIRGNGSHIDRTIANDGKTLNSSNVDIIWEDDYNAVVTLYGEEQVPETVSINFE